MQQLERVWGQEKQAVKSWAGGWASLGMWYLIYGLRGWSQYRLQLLKRMKSLKQGFPSLGKLQLPNRDGSPLAFFPGFPSPQGEMRLLCQLPGLPPPPSLSPPSLQTVLTVSRNGILG